MVQIGASRKQHPRKRIKFFKIIPVITLVLYAAWFVWIQSSIHQHTAAPTNQKFGGRVYCCITGQVQRLILKKKVETLLTPLQKNYGFVVDVALVLTDTDAHYTNPDNGLVNQPEFESFEAAKSYLEHHVEFFRVVTPFPVNTTTNPDIPQSYLSQMDKVEMPPDWQRRRVANHARQYETLKQCYKAMPQEIKYDFVIRIRDDVALEKPLQLQQIMHLLQDSTILASDCRTHGNKENRLAGLNDRLAILSPGIAQDYFTRPLQYFYSDINKKIHNPESFLYYTYQEPTSGDQPLNIVPTKQIRGVTKYVTNYKGVAVPAEKEDLNYCPKPWSWQNLFGE